MKPRNTRLRTLLFTLTTLAVVLGSLVAVYYFYIQSNTAYLDARNERVLNRLRSNMIERNMVYKRSVRTTTTDLVEDLRAKVQALINERIEAKFQLRKQRQAAEASITVAGKQTDSLPLDRQQPSGPTLLESPDDITIDTENRLFRIKGNEKLEIQSISFNDFQERYSERINLSFTLSPDSTDAQNGDQKNLERARLQPIDTTAFYDNYEISYQLLTGRETDANRYRVRLTLDLETFMEPLLRPDVFDHFVILRDTANPQVPNPANVVFTTMEDKRLALSVQRILPRLTDLQPDSGTIKLLERFPYRLYPQSMQFQGEEVVICGLVSDANFDKQRQQVSTILILLISLLVFVILLSFPILKMALMGRYERMRLEDLLLASMTAVLGTSLLALLLIDLFGYNGPDRTKRQRQLIELSEEIEGDMIRQIGQLNEQLKAYDTLPIYDRIMRRNLLAVPKDSNLFPKHFPFFKEIFWVTPDKQLARQWSTGNAAIPLVNVGGRDYYEDLMAGRGWRLPGDADHSERFTLASIRTRVNGELAAILARRSKHKIIALPDAKEGEGGILPASPDTLVGEASVAGKDLVECDIIMASADLPAVVNPVLPPGFGFVIIDQSGKVLFHADPTRNLQENFLEEVNLPALEAAMYSRSPLYDHGTYLGDGHDFFLQPVGQLPIFLITFRKRNYYQIAHAQIISLTFLMMLLTFLGGLAFVGVVVLFSPRNPVIKHDQFAFDWLRPFYRHRRRYRELIVNNLYTLLLAGLFTMDNAHPLVAISVIAVSYIFTFLLVFLRLNKNAHQQFMWAEYQRIAWLVITILVAGNLAMYTALSSPDFLRVLGYELLQGLVLVGVIGRIFADSRARGTTWVRNLYDWWGRQEQRFQEAIPGLRSLLQGIWRILDAQRSYRLFLATWLLILGVFPVVKYYEIAYNREGSIQVRFGQIEMAKRLIERREALEARYRLVPERDAVVSAFLQENLHLSSYLQTTPSLCLSPQCRLQLLQRLDSLARQWIDCAPHQATPDPSSMLPDTSPADASSADTLSTDTPALEATLDTGAEASFLPTSSPSERTDSADLAARWFLTDCPSERNRYRYYDSLLSAIRPRYDELTLRTNQIGVGGSANDQWVWLEFWRNGTPKLYYFHDDGFLLESTLPYYRFPFPTFRQLAEDKNAGLLMFWVLFGLFLAMIYGLVRFMIHKLFGRSALRIPTPDPIVAKRTLLDSEEGIFLMVPLRAVEQDYLSVIDIKIAEKQEAYYRPVPERYHYYFRLSEPGDVERLRSLMDRSPSPLDPGKRLSFSPLTEADENPVADQPDATLFRKDHHCLQDLPLIVIDDFDIWNQQPDACAAQLDLIEELLDYGIQVIIVAIDEPLLIQDRYANIMSGFEEEVPEEDRMYHLQRMGRLLSNFSKIDYPMERWAIFDYAEEALQFIQGKHAFLHVTSPAVLSDNRRTERTLRTLQIKVENRSKRAITKISQDTNTLVIDETYNDVLLDDRLETIHRWLEFDRTRPEVHQITVVSTITPLQIEEIYRNSGCEEEELRSKLRDWRRVLSLFYKGIVSDDPRRIPPEERVADLIRRECVHGPFLQSIQDDLLDQLNDYAQTEKGDRELKEEVILRIENRAHLYYQSLWAACTKEERYLIFDLAQDGLINASNLAGLSSLIRKGIVIQTPDTLTVMNKSFRNFVLTVIQPVDALRMELEIESQDLWRRLRTPISIMLFALGAFVFYTQRDILNETLAVVTGAAALIPTLGRILEAFTTVNLLPVQGLFKSRRKEEKKGA